MTSSAPKPKRTEPDRALATRVGYPDVWRDYRGLEIKPDDLFGNLTRAAAVRQRAPHGAAGAPDERGEWLLTPQIVNAYYVPAQNEIVLPAAILQPPYFDAAADDAVNYGAIGAVIGHEIGHARYPALYTATGACATGGRRRTAFTRAGADHDSRERAATFRRIVSTACWCSPKRGRRGGLACASRVPDVARRASPRRSSTA